MEQSLNPVQTAQILVAKKMMLLEQQFRNGVNQFYWIAGLSLVNTIISLSGGGVTFVIGLGITQMIDALAKTFAHRLGPVSGNIVNLFGLVLDLAIAGMFILFGIFGRKRLGNVILFGIILYAMDGLIFLVFKDWFAFIFHVILLISLIKGYNALNQLKKLEEGQSTGDLAAVQTLIAVTPVKPPVDKKKYSRNLLIFTLALIIPFGISIAIFLLLIARG